MAAGKLQVKDCPRPSVPEEGCAASGGWQATGSLGLMQGSDRELQKAQVPFQTCGFDAAAPLWEEGHRKHKFKGPKKAT